MKTNLSDGGVYGGGGGVGDGGDGAVRDSISNGCNRVAAVWSSLLMVVKLSLFFPQQYSASRMYYFPPRVPPFTFSL